MALNQYSDDLIQRQMTGRSSSTVSFASSPTHLSSTSTNDNIKSFSRLATFYLQDSSTSNFISSKSLQLLLEVETCFNEIREEISIRILDPNDPFFIYLYLIDFNEYKKIKQAQNLLVSFEKFSPKLIDIFQKCSNNRPSENSDTESGYILRLRNLSRTMLTLDVVEINEFKNLVHLSFDIPSANEEFIRSNYCSIYRKLKNEIESLRQQISLLDDQISSLTISKAKDLQNLKIEFANEKQSLEEKLKDSKQRFSEEQAKWNEADRCLKTKIQKIQFELKNSEELLEKERKKYDQQYQEWKEKLNQEVTKGHNQLKELEEKNQHLISEIELFKIERDQANQMVAKNEDEMNMVKNDLTKANEIIRKLQSEVKSCHDKMKVLNEVTQKQEETVGAKESTIERLSLDLKLCLQQLKNREKDIERLNTENDRQKTRCSQLELQLSTNKKIITHLNTEIDMMKLEKEGIKKEERFKVLRTENQSGIKSEVHPSSSTSDNKLTKTDNLLKDQGIVEHGERKNFLFTNVGRELPLKMVNLRTTNTNRNPTDASNSKKPL